MAGIVLTDINYVLLLLKRSLSRGIELIDELNANRALGKSKESYFRLLICV